MTVNGKVTEDDLKNVYSKYNEELRDTKLYANSLYSPSENVFYYISSKPFKEFDLKDKRIAITCIYCGEKYTPAFQSFDQRMCFCLYNIYKVNEKIASLKNTDEIYLNHNSEDKCIGNTTYYIKDIINEPKESQFIRACYLFECTKCHKTELKISDQ